MTYNYIDILDFLEIRIDIELYIKVYFFTKCMIIRANNLMIISRLQIYNIFLLNDTQKKPY